MANASVEESPGELWKMITQRAAMQLPDDMDLVELPTDRILEIFNFKSIQHQDKAIQRLENDLKEIKDLLRNLTK